MYTTGEWKTYRNALGTWAVSTDSEPIAQVERHYNARLIAAAPKLCEALEALVSHFRNNDENYYKSDLCTDAIAALSKAGERC